MQSAGMDESPDHDIGKAHDLLAPLYGWFTEGFDTSYLKNAKALLDELGLTTSGLWLSTLCPPCKRTPLRASTKGPPDPPRAAATVDGTRSVIDRGHERIDSLRSVTLVAFATRSPSP